jgi:hypothetical protein
MKPRSPLRTLAIAGCALILAAGALLLIVGAAVLTLRESPRVISGITPGGSSGAAYTLRSQQQAVAAERGAPRSFALLFYTVRAARGLVLDRP